VDRRRFLLAAAAAPFVASRIPDALAAGAPLALVTADTEAHVVAVELGTGRIRARIPTRPGPRSIERAGRVAVVAHTDVGAVSLLDSATLSVTHVLDSIVEPRYTAASRDRRHAFVTDSGRIELATIDVARGEVVGRLKLSLWPRHLSLSPDGKTLWVGLGTASPRFAVVDVSQPDQPRLRGTITPPFPMHDVVFAPGGRRAWVTSGTAGTIAVYDVHSGRVLRELPADEAPQHVTFLDGRAFVTSGGSGTLRVYDEPSATLLHHGSIPLGSFNVQFADGVVLTPSLVSGTLCIVDASGRVRDTVHVAPSSHDACLA
jgi:DNA-binding beta-propeller fold protein YncE